jgi:hypothetical protein
VADLAALHDTFACCTAAVFRAWRGDRDSALLSLLEAHAAAEEAFGPGSTEVDALSVVFAAIKHAAEMPRDRSPEAIQAATVLQHRGGPETPTDLPEGVLR